MPSRRFAVLAAAAAAFFAAAAVFAAPGIDPQVQQCDGSYLSGPNTHAPLSMPINVRASVVDPTGLRIGTARMGTLPISSTKAVYRFDSVTPNVTISDQGCVADVHCSLGKCWSFRYDYSDENGSIPTSLGQCIYNTANCSTTSGFATYAAGTLFATVPAGLGSCPATPPGTGTSAYFPASSGQSPASPLVYGGNGALSLPGNQFVIVSATNVWNMGGTYTISAWFKTSAAGVQTIFGDYEHWYVGNDFYWGLRLNNGKIEMDDSRDVTPQAVANSGPSLNNGAWHQVHIVRTNGVSRLVYADGVQVASFSPTISTSAPQNVIKFSTYSQITTSFVAPLIGATVSISTDGIQQGAASAYFTGQIDEVRVIDKALSADDIFLEYNGTNHRYSSNGGTTFANAPGSYGAAVNGTTSAQIYLPGETVASGSVWVFEAQSTMTDTRLTSQYAVTQDTSKPIASGVTGAPTSPTDVTWSWTAPAKVCVSPGTPGGGPYYQLIDCPSGAAVTPANSVFEPTRLIGETYGGLPNQIHCRQLRLTDVWGASPLSFPTTVYSLAAAPAALTFTPASISTGGFSFSWNTSANPAYTRYEVSYALDPAFSVGLTTIAALANNYTASSKSLTGLSGGTTYYVRVRAYSGRSSDFYGGLPTAFTSASVVTDPPAPVLTGAAQSNTSVIWTWTTVPGAAGYALYDSSNMSVLFSGGGTSQVVSSLGVNTRYDAEVEATMPAPTLPSARGHAFTYTLANAPVALTTTRIDHSSATFTWGANGNPAATNYELSIASDAAFGIVVATISVTGNTAAATTLFPGATYYARVRAFNGSAIATGFSAPLLMSTASDSVTSVSSAPASPYAALVGMSASWQFDEGSGLSAADASGNANTLAFTCTTAGCASTPTFAAGPAGLGTAASFQGLAGGVALSASAAPFNALNSLTVEAWVNPQSGAQLPGAGIVAVGRQGAEDFALDVTIGGAYRFLTANDAVALATASISAGNWTHVVGVYDEGASSSRLYLNGRLAAAVPIVTPHAHSGGLLSVGNRQNASSVYALPFFGRVDGVRVFNRALSGAEVQADYTGGFTSSVTAANSGVVVALPPNAFGAPALIYISADPINHPIRVPLSTLNAGLATPPDGLTQIPNSLIEVVPVVNGVAFTGPLGSSATLSIPYQDSNGDNLIDGTNPPLAASRARMYTLNTTVNRWELLPTTVSGSRRLASGVTPHFSVFALFAPTTVGSNLSAVSAYPVPWKPGSGGRFDGPGVSFANLPASGRIRILNLAGRRVRDFVFTGANAGVAVWDGANDDGRRTASGVYFAKITSDQDGSTTLIKFAVER